MIFKEASYLVGATVSNAEEAVRYASIAARVKKPIQLDLVPGADVAAVRDATSTIDVPIVVSGAVEAAAGVDLVLVAPDVEQFSLVAQMRKPFACMIEPAQVAERIEKLDEKPELRPWHYVITSEHLSDASIALNELFRTAPPLAHRVAGVRVVASALDAVAFEHQMRECVKTFGLQLAAVSGSIALDDYVEALARI